VVQAALYSADTRDNPPVHPWPELDRDFYMAFIIALPVELITIILYVKALKLSPLSLTVPFLALTPVFLVTVSYFLLGKRYHQPAPPVSCLSRPVDIS